MYSYTEFKRSQELLTAKGLEATWDRLGDISAAIDYLNGVKKKVSLVMKLSHKNKNHSDVDTQHLVRKVAEIAREQGLQTLNPNRVENTRAHPVINIIDVGEAKIKSSTLATFNKRIQEMVAGRMVTDEEENEMPENEVQLNWVDNTQAPNDSEDTD